MTFSAGYIASDLDLWQKHGIKVKTVAITGIGAINSVISGSSHFAQASASSFGRASARGQKLIAIATTIDRPFAQIVLRKEMATAGGYDAKSPLEKRGALLKGRTIAVNSINSMIHAYVRLVATRSGLNPDDIRVAPMAPASMLAAFQSKQIDGYAMSLPWPQKAVQDGEAMLIASGPDGEPGDMIPFGHNLIVTKQETCEKRKALCMAMGQSIKDADRLHQDQARRGLRAPEEAISRRSTTSCSAPRSRSSRRSRRRRRWSARRSSRTRKNSTSMPACSRPTRSSNPTTALFTNEFVK